MIIQSLKSNTKKINVENIKVVYNLIFENALYSLECYKVGCDNRDQNSYCYVENITDDEGEAEAFFHRSVKGKVFPIHMNDIVEDYFQA